MKVICINNKVIPGNLGSRHGASLLARLKEGDEYTVAELHACGYLLEETAAQQLRDRLCFDKSRFVATGGPDEQELHLQHVEKLTAEYVAKYGEPPIMKLDPVAFAKVWDGIKTHLGW